jgi:hypothetical protein
VISADYDHEQDKDEVATRVAKLVGAYSTGSENVRLAKSTPEAIALLRKWLNFGWQFRLKRTRNANMVRNPQIYKDRVEHELGLIISKGFVDYFLVTSDIVRWAKDNKIPVGPARGSAAASAVCYLLRITEVDPLVHPNMLFERFIDPTREELPDIDLDFDDERRHEVFDYAASKYGSANVAHIGNFTRYRGKNSLDDVARVYGIPKWEVETVKNLIIERSGGDSRISDSLEDTFTMFPKAQDVLDRYPEIANAVRLEGQYRGMGVHAAGLVISNEPINKFCATLTREVAGRPTSVIAYDKKDASYLGFLKQDMLGLATMGMVGHALSIIGMDLEDLYRVPITDKPTLQAFRQNDVTGIFQFEGRATRLVCRDVVPDHFQHLADINALSRPGPLFSGMAAAYVDVKHGKRERESYHPIVDEYAGWTYGQIVYQEQVLRIIKELGGFPMTRVHAIRQIISQKLGEAQFESMYAEFEENACAVHGCTPAQARRIWRFMATSATYSFCVTGDTILERGASGRYDPSPEITVEQAYWNQQSKTSIGDKMRDPSRGIKILGMDDDGRIRPNRLIKIHDPVPVQCYKITTNTGRSITVSKDHQMLADVGYLHFDEIKIGTNLVVSLGKEGHKQELVKQNKLKHPGQEYGSWMGTKQYDIKMDANPAWIDGRATYHKEAAESVKERDQNRCQHCGLEGDSKSHNLELAHILTLTDVDGDYKQYHNVDNMMLLCNSCHKKFDYQIQGTRNKRWTHGRPTGLEAVTSIEDAGIQLVYDISMEGPSHNYQGNGFINHNNIAHCISYSMLAFWQMWLKVHHPTAFYAAQLRKTPDEERRTKLLKDARRHGIEVVPPDLIYSDETWSVTDDGKVCAGFLQIPGVGPKMSKAIVDYLDSRATDANWTDLLEVPRIGEKTLDRIVSFNLDPDPFNLDRMNKIMAELREDLKPGNKFYIPSPTHTSATLPRTGKHEVVWVGIPMKREYKDLVEDERARTGKEASEILESIDDPHLLKSCVLKCIDDCDDEVYVRFNRWYFPQFQRKLESLRLGGADAIVVKGIKREGFGVSIQAREIWALEI